jgi:hypothetical protein
VSSNPSSGKKLHFFSVSSAALGSSEPPVQWLRGFFAGQDVKFINHNRLVIMIRM